MSVHIADMIDWNITQNQSEKQVLAYLVSS